ncbi:MAG: hypothetical protein QNJ90_06965 [Planctomycetota bacterium]|nr:hypothetical protein [Planctomycetota bacterium]
MNQKFLTMVATICGLVMVAALLIFPLVTWGEGDHSGSARAISAPSGSFLLMFTWLAVGFAGFVFLNKTKVIGIGENACRMFSLLGFKLAAFFFIAMLIDGANRGSWGIGFWLGFIASVIGAFAIYLTFNPDLAAKIADAAKSDDNGGDKPAESSGD